jgi:hypothetical protein
LVSYDTLSIGGGNARLIEPPVTIPPLSDTGQWDAFTAARQAMSANFRQEHPAARYRA